jgi:hypothetical protein
MILVIGDIVVLALVTIIGFATHGETDLSFVPRMFAAFVPLAVAWLLLSPWFGLFQRETLASPKQLWRSAFVMLFAGPFAVILRGLILNAPIIPIFAVVFSASTALGMMAWRSLYFLLTHNRAG